MTVILISHYNLKLLVIMVQNFPDLTKSVSVEVSAQPLPPRTIQGEHCFLPTVPSSGSQRCKTERLSLAILPFWFYLTKALLWVTQKWAGTRYSSTLQL